jgi:hypothetical protein
VKLYNSTTLQNTSRRRISIAAHPDLADFINILVFNKVKLAETHKFLRVEESILTNLSMMCTFMNELQLFEGAFMLAPSNTKLSFGSRK